MNAKYKLGTSPGATRRSLLAKGGIKGISRLQINDDLWKGTPDSPAFSKAGVGGRFRVCCQHHAFEFRICFICIRICILHYFPYFAVPITPYSAA